jgi:hypothetical protein
MRFRKPKKAVTGRYNGRQNTSIIPGMGVQLINNSFEYLIKINLYLKAKIKYYNYKSPKKILDDLGIWALKSHESHVQV